MPEEGTMVRQEIKSFTVDAGKYSGLPATSPCSLFSVLCDNGILGDPSISDNAAKYASLSIGECTFTSEFEITPLVLSMKNVILRFSGLDTLARIELNGHTVASTDNMHRTYDFEVKTKLCLGKNILRLTFTAPKELGRARRVRALCGTDSSPRLPDMGIFRKIEIVAFNHKIISDVKVKQTHTDGAVRLDLSISTVGYDELSRAVGTLTSPAGNVYFCGFVRGEGSITITDPNLWWPNGLGMQNLYKLNINLYSEIEIEDTYEIRIGLRTVALERSEDGTALLINGERMLLMGGEYMCEDVLLSRLTPERTARILESAKNANFNSVYVHGSGYYPEKYFFDRCDELGLIAIMELPDLLCGVAPDEALKENIKAEIRDNITAMAHHPSLALIEGNKTVLSLFTSEREADDFAGSFSAFEGMNVFDVTGESREHFVRIGYDSLPTYPTVVRMAEPEKRNLGSDVFELHGASGQSAVEMIGRAYENYPYANGMSELSYVMGMCSAELSMDEAEAARRRERKPLGILMRRMNDTWPSISPSAVDYYGSKKPLHYYERAFFAPVRISLTMNGTRARFTVCNNMRQDYVGIFAYAIMNSKNQPMFRDSFPIRARAASNLEVHGGDLGSIISGHENEYYLLYSIADKSNEASKGIHLFTKSKRFAFQKPNYSIEITGNGTEYVVAISADCFVKGVEISFLGEEVSLDKNYFDITGKAPVRVHLRTPRMTTVEKLKRIIKLRSVYDLGREE